MTRTASNSSGRAITVDVVVFAVAFGLASITSYVYLVIAGRTLTVEQFGVFNTLLGFIAISGFFASSLQLAVAQAAVLDPTRSAFASLMRGICRIAFPGLTVLTLAAIPFASSIGATATQLATCGIVALAIFLACTASGFLLGIGRVRTQASVNLFSTVLQLGVGWLLMRFGLGVTGAVFGYLSNYTANFVLTYWINWQLATDHVSKTVSSRVAPPLRLHGSAVATFVLAFCPFSLDQLLVQTVAPQLGGTYAALATMSKPVFFAAYPIIGVVYSHLLRLSDERRRLNLVAVAAGGVICIAGAFALAIAAFPRELTEMLFAGRFPEAVPCLGSLASGVACFSVSILGAHALIAWRSTLGFLPSLVTIAVQVGLFSFRHDSLAAVVSNQVWTYGIQLILLLAVLALSIARSPKL